MGQAEARSSVVVSAPAGASGSSDGRSVVRKDGPEIEEAKICLSPAESKKKGNTSGSEGGWGWAAAEVRPGNWYLRRQCGRSNRHRASEARAALAAAGSRFSGCLVGVEAEGVSRASSRRTERGVSPSASPTAARSWKEIKRNADDR
jgi:hypothetical protein